MPGYYFNINDSGDYILSNSMVYDEDKTYYRITNKNNVLIEKDLENNRWLIDPIDEKFYKADKYYYYSIKYDKDVLEILKDLENDYYFKRYDLNRYVILKQFTKKINVESMKLYELDFDACLKYTSHRCKKYYLEHKDDEVYYPFI